MLLAAAVVVGSIRAPGRDTCGEDRCAAAVRLDKFLQVSRLVRRRVMASRLCDAGRVTVNGRPAKAAAPVRAGDVLGIVLGTRRLVVRVVQVPERPAAGPTYEVLEDERIADVW